MRPAAETAVTQLKYNCSAEIAGLPSARESLNSCLAGVLNDHISKRLQRHCTLPPGNNYVEQQWCVL
jgi:hypothetical protein